MPSTTALRLAAPWTRAWLGEALTVEATSPTSMALLAMGFGDQTWAGQPLPLDLTSRGVPGCALLVAPEAVVLATGQNNVVPFSVPIPRVNGLLGLQFYQQAFALAPAANPLGLSPSDSWRGMVGWSH